MCLLYMSDMVSLDQGASRVNYSASSTQPVSGFPSMLEVTSDLEAL